MVGHAYDLFVAHAEEDRALAEQLVDLLVPGMRVWLAVRSLPPGDAWSTEIPRAQCASLATVILVSKRAANSHYVREEVLTAIALGRVDPSKHRVLPVFLDGRPADVLDVPYGLRAIQGLDATTRGIPGVAEELRELVQAWRGPSPASPLVAREGAPAPSSLYGVPRFDGYTIPRLDHVSDLETRLRPVALPWAAVLTGAAGTGKTAIALELVQELAHRGEFKKILWVDPPLAARVAEDGLTVTGRDYLKRLVELHPGRSRASSTEDLGRVTEVLCSDPEATLVVFDGVDDRASLEFLVRAVLPFGHRTKFLLTTRLAELSDMPRRQNLVPVRVGPFTPSQARALVNLLCEDGLLDISEPDRRWIVEVFGDSPEPLLQAVAFASESRDWVTGVRAEIDHWRRHGAAPNIPPSLIASFELLYRNLDSNARRLLELLGFFPHPLTAQEAESILEMSSADVRDATSKLDRLLLLRPMKSPAGRQSHLQVSPQTRMFVGSLKGRQFTAEELRRRYASGVSGASKGARLCTFTRNNTPIVLPTHSTVMDFAYLIHSDLGDMFASARINGVHAEPALTLRGGEVVVIHTGDVRSDLARFLPTVRTPRAKRAIRYRLHAPERAKRIVRLGDEQSVLGRLTLAEEHYRHALSVDGGSVVAYNRLGHVLRKLGKWDEAGTMHQQAHELTPRGRPERRFALSGLAALAYVAGDFSRSKSLYRGALAESRVYANAQFGLARACLHLREDGEAHEMLNAIVRGEVPKHARRAAYLFLALVLLRAHSTDAARDALDRARRGLAVRGARPTPLGSLWYQCVILACVSAQDYCSRLQQALSIGCPEGLRRELLVDLSLFSEDVVAALEATVKPAVQRCRSAQNLLTLREKLTLDEAKQVSSNSDDKGR
jgi:tetratricopeptide (TPR) repeat protein